MKSARRFLPWVAIAAAAVLAFVLAGPLVQQLSYAAAKGANDADREMLESLSQGEQLSKLFRAVARTVKPAVVEVKVKKRIAVPQTDMNEFFQRFFGGDESFRQRFGVPQQPPPQGNRERYYFQQGLGSGVIVDAEEGYLLTNHHVVVGADEVEIILADGRKFDTEWVRSDPQTDLAVVKIKGDNLVGIPLGDSDKIEVGDWVLAVGAPESLPQTVTAGIISAKGRTTGSRQYEDFLQTDAAINHGNSGGPLVNMHGEVIGITSAIVSRTGVNEGIGLAIPSSMARKVMDQLVDTGKVVRGYLGVMIQDVDDRLAKNFGLPDSKGVLVDRVLKDSPAEAAGLKDDDFIVAVNGKAVDSVNDLRNLVADIAPDEQVKVTLLRDGEKKTLPVKVAAQPEDMAAVVGGGGEQAQPAKYGLEVQTLTKELAQQAGFDENTHGVLVTGVEGGSEAADAGVRPGMVIDRVGKRGVRSASDFADAVSAAGGKDLRLRLLSPGGGRKYVIVPAK